MVPLTTSAYRAAARPPPSCPSLCAVTGTEIARGLSATAPLVRRATIDVVFVALAGWLMTGVFLDAGAHIRRLPDTFWTPWHAVLYSGLFACGAFLVGARLVEARSGRRLLDDGYALSLLGVAVGGIGGITDAIWHTLFGIEFDLDAAVSPSHLIIAAAIVLVVSGPARAAWRRGAGFGVAATLSLLYALSMLTVILDYANPFAMVVGADQGLALFAFTAYGALLAGATLLAVRGGASGWAIGAIAGGNAAVMTLPNAPLLGALAPVLLAVALVGGVLIAVASTWLRQTVARPSALLVLAALVPAILEAGYVIAVASARPASWTVTFWCGLVAVGALAGLLVGALVVANRPAD